MLALTCAAVPGLVYCVNMHGNSSLTRRMTSARRATIVHLFGLGQQS